MAEKRRWIRIKPNGLVPRTGKIVLGDKAEVIDCRIVDLSAGGACLELSKLYDLPKRFEFIHGHTRTFCRLAWSRGYRVGVMYEVTKQRAMIAGGLSRTTTGVSRLSRDRHNGI
jgi:PilZ domain